MKIFRGQLIREASNYLPNIRQNGVRWGESSGVRAQALDRDGTLLDDFLVTEAPGSVHVRNAPSPAATSSLALAQEIVARVQISPDWKFHESR
jgi:L-2-hydroxyglutarate oxidase LhgO